MTTRALCYRTGTYQKSVAFTRRKDVWICKRLAAEVEHLELGGQVLRNRIRLQLEIGAAAVESQKGTLETVTRCVA